MKKFKDFLDEFYKGQSEFGLFAATNENDENMVIEITSEYLKTSVLQNNGWMRVNIYYKDHTTEEFYEK